MRKTLTLRKGGQTLTVNRRDADEFLALGYEVVEGPADAAAKSVSAPAAAPRAPTAPTATVRKGDQELTVNRSDVPRWIADGFEVVGQAAPAPAPAPEEKAPPRRQRSNPTRQRTRGMPGLVDDAETSASEDDDTNAAGGER